MKIPTGYTYAEVYLTFRCNLGCSYCINAHKGISRKRNELTGPQWVECLSQYEWGDLPITFGGGEPTLHPDFYDIVNGLPESIKVDLLTNLSFRLEDFVARTNPKRFCAPTLSGYKGIRVSYHAEKMNRYELVEKVAYLQDAGYPIGIFGINHPTALADNIEMAELARKHRVYFFIKDFLGEINGTQFGYYRYPEALDGAEKTRRCRTNELIVGPDGGIFRCHYDLYTDKSAVGFIRSGMPEWKMQTCTYCGLCNPCDVKMKTNRFLQAGHSSVEIEEIT